ncbi:hypothetical protein ES703_101722 [subsurface metagenome]
MVPTKHKGPHITPSSPPINSVAPTGRVLATGELVNKTAKRNSFQEKIIQSTATAIIPGIDRGRVILKKEPRVEQPNLLGERKG